MAISNSSELQFWPELYPPQGTTWLAGEATYESYRTTYSLLFLRHPVDVDQPNVSGAEINILVAITNDTLDTDIPYCNEGWVDVLDPFYQYILPLDVQSLAVGEFNLDPFQELYSMGVGLFVWQRYKLRLAMQVDKLSVFGFKGPKPGS
jgi:hypothetical protein